MPNENQKISERELAKIRRIADFDLIMLISEIHDHGWQRARTLLPMMPDPMEANEPDTKRSKL